MSNVLEKVRKFKASRPVAGSNKHMKGIFHTWEEHDNQVRLAGEFLEVRTHFIAPAPKRNERGLCQPVAFQGEGKLPQVVNCWDWDIEKEGPTPVKTCPICRLRKIALAVLHENPTPEEKEYFEGLLQTLSARRNVKWNIIDRKNPYVTAVEGGQEQQVLGFKIATFGMEAYNDIEGIFEQCGVDITDPEQGIDIKVVRGHNGTRTTYTAQACLRGTSLLVTPFNDDERALVLHDLKAVCGKLQDSGRVIDALHEDLRQLLEVNVEETEPAAEEGVVEAAVEAAEEPAAPAPVPAPRPAVPAARPVAAAARPAAPAPRPAVAAPAARPAVPAARPVAAAAAPAARPAAPAPRPAAPAARPAVRPAAVLARPVAKPVQKPVARLAVPAEEAAAVDEAIGDEGGDGLGETPAQKKS